MRSWLGSLTARTMLVLLVAMVAVHALSLWTYQHALDEEVILANETRLADRLLTIKRAVMRAPAAEREAVAHDLSGGPIEAHWSRSEHAIPGGPGADAWRRLGERLRELAPELAEGALVIGANRRLEDDPHLALISMRLPDESWVNVSLVSWTPRAQGGHGTLLSTSFMAFGALIVAVLMVRWLTRPLSAFADAAKRFYGGAEAAPVPETGPTEVRALAAAFNDMQRRIRRLVDDRTQALAAVSHDLKTPITRLRFRIEEFGDPAQRAAIAADLDEMERMIDQTLAFLRGDRSDEELRAVDVVAILETIADDLTDAGGEATLSGAASAVVLGRHLALKRALSNLVQNAVRYGERVRIAVETRAEAVAITIADDGPGIPPERMAEAFEPFVRLESSRNPATGGTGLGLTIAKAIVDGHGGSISLANGAGGGLVATLLLPKAGRPA
jgi:signal transduction histidine kinase